MSHAGIVDGIKVDVVRLHETWMELVFPRQRTAVHQVLGKWEPRTRGDQIKYRTWAALGIPIVAILYPLLLLGFATRFNARRFDSATTRLGIIGVVILTAILWGALTAIARIRFNPDGFIAVGAASIVAVISAGLAVMFTRVGGRGTTVVFAYPFAMNAIFLPPVVATIYEPSLTNLLEQSEAIAIFLLDTIFDVYGLNDYFRDNYSLEGIGVILMWVGIATPFGWLLGLLVTLADVVRPRATDADTDESN